MIGALKDVLELDDIRQITDFKIVPYVSSSMRPRSIVYLLALMTKSSFLGKHQI